MRCQIVNYVTVISTSSNNKYIVPHYIIANNQCRQMIGRDRLITRFLIKQHHK